MDKLNYINIPNETPENVTHNVFFSKLYGNEIGYNIYLPPDYYKTDSKYPVLYHLHGWTGNESSEIHTCEKVYANKQTIVVFPNCSPVIGDRENLPVETMLLNEFIPHIEEKYRIISDRDYRSISGFSMGGCMAFNYTLNHPDVFSSVTVYAGAYHHAFHKNYSGVGEKPEKAVDLYRDMISNQRFQEENNALYTDKNILYLIRQNIKTLQDKVDIRINVGTKDPLFCENEIMHLFLESLDINHKYNVFENSDHDLSKIL